jgi:hypothetical protein
MMGGMTTKTLALTAVLALSLAGCADKADAPTADPRAAVLQAMTSAYEAGTMHEEFRMEMSAAGEELAFTGEADIDSDRQLASMSMDLGMLGGSMDMIVADGVVYLRSPAFSGTGTQWVSMDPSRMDPATAASFGGGFGGGGFGGMNDPSTYVGLFAGVVDVETVGRETIGGVRTTHYDGTIDVGEVLRRLPEVLGDDVDRATLRQLREGVRAFEALGADARFPFDLWVDDEGYPRRETFSMDLGDLLPGDEEATMDMRVDFSAFGEPVDVDVPERSEVTDITELMEGATP